MPDIMFIVAAVAFAAIVVYSFIRNNKIRRNGIEVYAMVSRIEEHDAIDADGDCNTTYTYYVTYCSPEGQNFEAVLYDAPGYIRTGDRISIKYLPEKPKAAVFVK